jgi:hypothetical protein
MILAISIFSMIVAVIFSTLRVGLGAWEKGERDIGLYQEIRAVSELLNREISSTYPYQITPGPLDTHKTFLAFFGKSDSLKFVSYANVRKRAGGLSLLEMWVDNEKGLMMGESVALVSNLADIQDINLRDEDNALIVSNNVEKINFRYFEREKTEDDGVWVEQWDPDNKKNLLPLFVEITIVFKDRFDEELKERLIVPIMSIIV